MKSIPFFLVPLLLPLHALAQSSPGWAAGDVPTATQWNAEWASKADSLNPTFSGALSATGTSLVGSDWLSGDSAAGLTWPVPASQSAALSTGGKVGLTGASRASDLSSSYGSLQTTIGIAGIAVNDDVYASSGRHVTVYGGYDEAETFAGSQGLTFGREIDASNLGGVAPAIPTPGAPLSDGESGVPGTTGGVWVASGGGHSNASDSSFAVGIKDNGARFLTGIVIGANALTNYNGYSFAMRLPKGSLLQWHDSSDVAGPNIGSTVASAANAMSLQFQDGGTVFLNPGATTVGLSIQSQVGAVDGLAIQPVVSGASPQIMAEGSDANIGINLVPKGSGAVYTPALLSAGSLYSSGSVSVGGTLYATGTATLNSLASSNATITGGAISATPISGASGAFTTLSSSSSALLASASVSGNVTVGGAVGVYGTVTAPTFAGALSGNANTATIAGNVSGTVAIANGGTGATTASAALSALGAAPLAAPTFTGTVTANTLSSSGATITGGTVNATTVGATTAATGKFTTLTATGATSLQSTLGVTGAATLSSTLATSGHAQFASGTTPSVAANACGSTTQGTVSGTDQSFALTIGTASVTSCTVTFGSTFATAPNCSLTPANSTAAAWGTTAAYVSSTTTTALALAGSALASAKYIVHCM